MNQTSIERTPRRTRSDGERSRHKILDAAAKLATTEGLEGLSIGRLADHIGMSKSGLYAHFGSKEELQLATIETADEIFAAEVVAPAEQMTTPLAKLETLCEEFLSHIERRVFPGGCFFASAAAEFDTHPGPVQERIATFQDGWNERLVGLIRDAEAAGELHRDDAEQLAFELNAHLLMANTAFLLYDSPEAMTRARTAIADRIARSRTTRGRPR
jgi:AcrR family transcriptional regulator